MSEPKCSVFIATSADGFIARPDGDVSWLHKPEYEDAATLGVTYSEFISTVDAILMGRNTFEKVLTFGEWPYNDIEVIVLTNRELSLPGHITAEIRTESGSPEDITERLAGEGYKHLYIDGGLTIQRFLEAGLIDEMTITGIPVLLGEGIPLFGQAGKERDLELIEVFTSESGVLQKRYIVK